MVAELDDHFSRTFPSDVSVFLMLGVPLKNIRETKKHLISEIDLFIASDAAGHEALICENRISFSRIKDMRCSMAAGYANRHSSSNITENAKALLADRIVAKSVKVRRTSSEEEYWLALFNHYWIARPDSYQVAYKTLNLEHEFDKVFVITEYGEAVQIS